MSIVDTHQKKKFEMSLWLNESLESLSQAVKTKRKKVLKVYSKPEHILWGDIANLLPQDELVGERAVNIAMLMGMSFHQVSQKIDDPTQAAMPIEGVAWIRVALTYRLFMMLKSQNRRLIYENVGNGLFPVIRRISIEELWDKVKEVYISDLEISFSKGRPRKHAIPRHLLIMLLGKTSYVAANNIGVKEPVSNILITALYYLINTYGSEIFKTFVSECVNAESIAQTGLSLKENVAVTRYLVSRRWVTWNLELFEKDLDSKRVLAELDKNNKDRMSKLPIEVISGLEKLLNSYHKCIIH